MGIMKNPLLVAEPSISIKLLISIYLYLPNQKILYQGRTVHHFFKWWLNLSLCNWGTNHVFHDNWTDHYIVEEIMLNVILLRSIVMWNWFVVKLKDYFSEIFSNLKVLFSWFWKDLFPVEESLMLKRLNWL